MVEAAICQALTKYILGPYHERKGIMVFLPTIVACVVTPRPRIHSTYRAVYLLVVLKNREAVRHYYSDIDTVQCK
jgi:hypothetical protein